VNFGIILNEPSINYTNKNRARKPNPKQIKKRQKKRSFSCCGCSSMLFIALTSISCLVIFLFFPSRTNILLLGLDYADQGGSLSRTDTIILSTFVPLEPYVGMLSIPRDLWVKIPGVGENRINTAHFYAELNQKNSGPKAVVETIKTNFNVKPDYYVIINFDGFREIINALGGLDIKLDKPMAGYPPGQYHLTGKKTLAFVRDRNNSDDFFRMENGQFILKQLFSEVFLPNNWIKLPSFVFAVIKSIDSNIPFWIWPRIFLGYFLTGSGGIDSRTITRDMVVPHVTEQGAHVLIPIWDKIYPVVLEMFGK
jgi:LCP family protein required for cell wall assembly